MQPKLAIKSFAVAATLLRSVMSQANGYTHIASPFCQFDVHNELVHALAGMYWW